MAKSEFKDDGRRCVACGGSGQNDPLFRFKPVWDVTIAREPIDLHSMCAGAYLTGNPSCTLQFAIGYPGQPAVIAHNRNRPVDVAPPAEPARGVRGWSSPLEEEGSPPASPHLGGLLDL